MNIITHRIDEYNVDEELTKLKKLLVSKSNDAHNDENIQIFDQLCKFEFGRWLLINRGLNAYWAYYLIYFDECCHDYDSLLPLEKIMLLKSPGVIASRERAKFDCEFLQKSLKDDMKIASVPCGFMNDLLRLDLSGLQNVELVGIDLDPQAIECAQQNAVKFGKQNCSSFLCRDAWDLGIENEFDLIRSSGLNMYVQKEDDLLKLYKNFYRALKSNGILMVGSNVPPVDEDGKFIWNISDVEFEFIEIQAIVYNNIINVRQGIYCTKNQIINQLKAVGFVDIDVNCDKRNMFLGFVARKLD